MGWWNESKRHSLARKGIKTAGKPKMVGRGSPNDEVMKHKLSDNIHKNITKLDRALRKVANLEDPQHIQRNLKNAERHYASLGTKIDNHKKKYGNMPDWIQYDWVHNESFNEHGKIYKQIQNMKDISPDKLKKEQNKLWNLIALRTERRR